jgi:hypothetical protein
MLMDSGWTVAAHHNTFEGLFSGISAISIHASNPSEAAALEK